jgi:hypothetical protein
MKYPFSRSAPLVVLACFCASFTPGVWGTAFSRSLTSEERGVRSHEAATATIPGPLRSFLRMAAISQKVSPEEVMPFLARNIFLLGYESKGGSKVQPTEFLILLRRYVQQARELAALAGADGVIHVSNCEDGKELLEILGYRPSLACGRSGTFLETADPRRAFLTIDSGFPLAELERTLQGGKPFSYPFPNSQVPIFLAERDWTAVSDEGGKDEGSGALLDALLHHPALARLYDAWARIDSETQFALARSPGLRKLAPYAASLDFYGSYIRVRSGRVLVPGGSVAESGWNDLVGVSPQSPGEFVLRLIAKDHGWLAAYFDSLSRVPPEQQAHFVEPPRLRRCYEALRGKTNSPSAMVSVFRPDPFLLLLITRLQWEPDGNPHVPGNLQAWKSILSQKANLDIALRWNVEIPSWNNSEGFLEALFALSRVRVQGGPTEAFLALCELDGRRSAGHRLSAQTVELMAGKFSEFRNQYLIFSEFPELSDASIATFLKTAGALGKIPDVTLRGNAMGIFEANVGLWQILARQREINQGTQNDSWREMIGPFAHVSSSTQLFDAGRESLGQVLRAASGEPKSSQNEIIDLIAGPRQTNPEGQRIHKELADRIRAVLDDQRLVSLDTLLALGDGLSAMAQGAPMGNSLVQLAEQLTDFQMPRPIFTRRERSEFSAGAYNDRHTELEMRTDLAKVLKSRSNAEIGQARGLLASFLRDTLVGLNYAYYEPPGAQALHHNPLLIRSHDFSGETVIGMERSMWLTPRLFGVGSPAGGGAHLVGSLADLPYVLAEMEEDFISPENVQALIWSDLVPCVLTDAVLPRWWDVTRNELHAVALYQRVGEELLSASAENKELRSKVTSILSDRMAPPKSAQLEDALREGRLAELSSIITPADTFYLTAEIRRRFPEETNSWGAAGRELVELSRQDPAALRWERLSQDFGMPHPILAGTNSRELLNLRPFPTFEGYSSRLLAETWDSTNLYWARLADEMGYSPVTLNRLAPELTLRTVAKIFATDLNDWPAVLRAMRETGEEFLRGKVPSLPSNDGAPQP